MVSCYCHQRTLTIDSEHKSSASSAERNLKIIIFAIEKVKATKMAQTRIRSVQKMCDLGTFQCPFCVAAFKSSVALQAHAVYSHRVGFFTCAWCTEVIENEPEIQKHAKSCSELAKREVKIILKQNARNPLEFG